MPTRKEFQRALEKTNLVVKEEIDKAFAHAKAKENDPDEFARGIAAETFSFDQIEQLRRLESEDNLDTE